MKRSVEQHHVDLLLKYVKAKLKFMEEVDVEFQNGFRGSKWVPYCTIDFKGHYNVSCECFH
jgi:hypothetical protein